MAKSDEVVLTVNGKRFEWWESVSITMKLLSITREFSVGYTRNLRNGEGLLEGLPKVGQEVEFSIGGDVLATGYVTKADQSYNATSVNMSVSGASKTIDLVQCTLPITAKHQYKSIDVVDFVQSIAGEYGITVSNPIDFHQKSTQTLTPTKKLGGVIQDIANQFSILITDDERGNLVITSIGQKGLTAEGLQTGKNILEGSRNVDAKDVYSTYTVVGQASNSASEKAVTAFQNKASSSQGGVRKREIVVNQSGDASLDLMQRKATLLKNHSVASAETFEYTVQGWRQSNGALWEPNYLVRVTDDILGVDETLVIDEVTLKKDNGGTTTVLHCVRPESLVSTEVPDAEKKSTSKQAALDFTNKGTTKNANWTDK